MNRRIHYRIMMLFMISGAAALIYQVCWQRLLFESVGVDIESVTIIVSTFMMGLGLGALVGGELADRFPDWTLAMFGIIELATAAFGAFSSYLIHAVSLAVIQASTAETAAANFGLLLCPTLRMGATLPILVKRVMQLYQNIGESVGVLYFANTLGAAFGAGFTGFVALYYMGLNATIHVAVALNVAVSAAVWLSLGFVALDHLSVDQCFEISAVICLLASAVGALKAAKPKLLLVTAAAAISSLAASWLILPYPGSLAAFAIDSSLMNHFIANRHGVIHTARMPKSDHVFGGNAYDGMATVDVDSNQNRMDRVYLVALMSPAPRRVLFVGLSTGAWVRAIEGVPAVESIDVVEINPGYLALIRDYYPQLALLLADPRVHVHIDDGRRWLRRNPDTRFDVVIQNTTFHWRANIGNLLSREYFSEVTRHLSPGGIFYRQHDGVL